jgi:dihydroxyacid dehydratase/phosphogluconate dehydratase
MLHLRRMGLLNVDVTTVTGEPLSAVLDWWESSDRRRAARERLRAAETVDPDRVIMSPDAARREGLTSTVVFPVGNVAPEGSVVKATAIDPSVVGDDGVFRHRGPARVFTSEHDAIAAIKGLTSPRVAPGDILVVIGVGPLGTGMEETYQLTSALKYLPWGKQVAIVTDARFSGVSTGACIGHVGPEALAGGPVGRLVDGDVLEIVVDRHTLEGRVDLVGVDGRAIDGEEAGRVLASRPPHAGLAPDGKLPADTRLWAALQQVGGGTWGGCVYDVDRIIEVLEAGERALKPGE